MSQQRQRHGKWLGEQRRARGWAVPEMLRRLRQAAEEAGDKLPPDSSLQVMIYRWEDNRSGISQRYRLHYSRALGIPYEAFGKSPTAFQPPELPATAPPLNTTTAAQQVAGVALMLAEAAISALNALAAFPRDSETRQ